MGELGDAVWKYLEVLEVDPDNAVARRQVGRVATAVRQFDEKAPAAAGSRRSRSRTAGGASLANVQSDGDMTAWLTNLLLDGARGHRPGVRLPVGFQAARPVDGDKAAKPPAVRRSRKKARKTHSPVSFRRSAWERTSGRSASRNRARP